VKDFHKIINIVLSLCSTFEWELYDDNGVAFVGFCC
jgi:hypothetical protein